MAMIGHRLAAGLALMLQDSLKRGAEASGQFDELLAKGLLDREWSPTGPYRGMGVTTSQMRRAPRGAVYLWPEQATFGYARHLAHHLGRDDLQIMHMRALDGGGNKLRGLRMTGLVVDHACWNPARMDRHRERALEFLMPLVGKR